jgi:uncharacterized protein involved in outer membrane biogenesis
MPAFHARKLFWWLAGLVAAFAAIGFLVVPPIAKSKLEETLSQALHRKVTLETVRVNPFAPSVTLRGFAVSEPSGDKVFAGFDELYVNAAWTSIFRLAPVVDEITLVKPHLRVVRNPDRSYNFQDLLDEFLARPKSDAPPPKFALFNIRLLDGRVDFEDQAEAENHVVSGLRIGIPFISSLPAHAEIKVLPELAANVNGAQLSLSGDTLPFTESRATHLKLDLDGFDLTRLADYLPFEPRAKLGSALLDTRLVVAFEQPAGKAPQVKLRGSAAILKLAVLDPHDRPVIAWERLGVELNEVEPLLPRIDLKSVALDGADVRLRRDKSGAINLAQLGPAAPARDKSRKEQSGAPLALKIETVALRFEKLAFNDQTTQPAFDASLEELRLDGSGLDLGKGKRSEWTLSARSDAGETIKLAAGATADPPAADGQLDIAGVHLKRYQPYVDAAADLRIDDGKLDLGLAFRWANQELKLADIALALQSLRARLPDEKEPFIRVGSLQMKGGGADLAARTADLGEIAVREVAAAVRRQKDGVVNVARIARPGKAPEQGKARPWRVDLAKASLERGALTFEDLASAEPVKIRVAPLQLKAERLSTAKGQRGNVSLRATIDRTGTLTASGPISLDPLAARLKVAARTIGFVPAQRYIDDKVHFAITSGALSAKGEARFEMPPGGPVKAAYKGDVDITDFASVDKRSTQDLLKWKALSLGAIDFEMEPMKVSLDQIALSEYYARIIVSAEGRFNLQDLVAAKSEPPAEKPRAAAPAPNVRIGKILLQGGNVNFSDFYIQPNYGANLTGIGGAVTEMTPEKAGDVDLRGKIDNAAPVEIVGRVNPLAADLFLDMKGSARDIELSPLSPYAVKYAGYGIERGKLSVNVKYAVDQRKLVAENQIYLDQLTFGERVESPTATKLPVTLAVALLKDRNGVIDIRLPISGSLDDPQFSLGGIIFKVIVNLIVKAVTAPFALLGSLFGGGEELAYLEFAPGSAALAGGEQPKLESLARALTERPGLKLDITGRAAPEADREGLKRAALDAKVRAQKFNDLRRAGKAPASAGAVTVEPAEYEKYLRRAYGEEKFPKPRNVVGIAKELPVAEMEKLMLEHTPVAEDDLRLLANARAQAAKEWLATDGKVPAERMFIVAPKLTAEDIKDKGGPARADFGLK